MSESTTEIRQLLDQEMSADEVARQLGVSVGRVRAVKAHMTMGTYGQPSPAATGIDVGDLEDVVDAADLKFGLERDMQEALRRNIHQLDPTLRIVDEGKERHVEVGFIDILAQADDGALVVIELKPGEAPESAITQVLSYIGSLQSEDSSQTVRGMLIARAFSTRVRFAARAGGIQLVTYGYNFTFTPNE